MRASWVGPCSKPCWVPKKAASFGLMIKTTHFSVGLLKLIFLRPGKRSFFTRFRAKKHRKVPRFYHRPVNPPRPAPLRHLPHHRPPLVASIVCNSLAHRARRYALQQALRQTSQRRSRSRFMFHLQTVPSPADFTSSAVS